MDGPGTAAGGLAEWGARLARDAGRFRLLQAEIASIRVVESSSDGAIRVTVDVTGAVVDIATSGRLSSVPSPEIGRRIMGVVARAQSRLPEQVRWAAHATLGEDARTAAPVWEQLRARFTEPSPGRRPRREPAPAPVPRSRPRRAADDEVWADEPILRPASEKREDRS